MARRSIALSFPTSSASAATAAPASSCPKARRRGSAAPSPQTETRRRSPMFSARLATAVVLLAACVSALLLLPNHWWSALLVPILLAAAWEWGALAGFQRAARWAYSGSMVASTVLAWIVVAREPALEIWIYGAAGVFWVGIAPAWLARGWRTRSPLALALTGAIVLVPAWLALARLQADPQALLAILGIIW